MQRQKLVQLLKIITYIGIYGGLLMPLFFWPIVIFPFVFSKLLYFQFLIGLTFPAYLTLAWFEPRYRPRFSLLYVSIVAYFIALGVSVIFSIDSSRSWWGNQERMNGLFTLLHFLAWLSMAVGTLKTWPQWRRLLNYEIGLSAFMAMVTILQKPFPQLLQFPVSERLGGLLDNPIYMAAYQIFNLFFLALLWMKSSSRQMRIFYILIGLLDVGAFIFAQSRGALVGLGAGILIFAITYAMLTPGKNIKRGFTAFILLCFISYGALFAFRDTDLVRNSTLARFTNFSGASRTRLIAWEIAWKGFLDRPITGYGLDTFHILFNEKYNAESLRFGYYETWFDRAHNTVMDVLSMTGLLGFVTFAAMYISLYVSIIRSYRKRWIDVPIVSVLIALPVAYFVQNLFVFDHPALFSMSYLLFALVIAASFPGFAFQAQSLPEVVSEKPKSTTWALAIFIILQISAACLVWRTTVLPFWSSILSIRSNKSFSFGQYEQAFKEAQQSYAVPTFYLDEQTFLQARNFISLVESGKLETQPFWREWHDLIIRITDDYLARHPNNAHSCFVYARFAETMSRYMPEDSAIAEAQYLKGIELSPKRQQMYFSYARFLIDRKRSDEAVKLLEKVVTFDPDLGEPYWLLGLHLFFDRGETQSGAEMLLKGINAKYIYVLKTGQEAMALAMAYEQSGEKDKIKDVIAQLPDLPQAPLNIYMEIARIAERVGLITERDMIINALSRIDQNVAFRLSPLLQGHVTSIQASLDLTEGVIVTPSAATSSPVTTTTTSGAGPRIK